MNDPYHPYTPFFPSPASMGLYGQNAKQLISMVEQEIAGENVEEAIYDYLYNQAPAEQERDVIVSMRDDIREHRNLFKQMYSVFTGRSPMKVDISIASAIPQGYLAGLEMALLGKLRSFHHYREMYENIPERFQRKMFEVLTDQWKHVSYLQWLYAKNK